ncbi:hypothetical protein GTA08_BOTSDO14233 [Botryosphaeria dothidea]|uniref:FAD-binding PCMH-type domain-containing protein n=1 Tax=Botryosphaeria dothidea TaxID=55169 RepID=A0A8H4INT3_9PEZI|nr:hypothetical protein GTA08_BOTSDO14233 [Botryosphaeria dothidea]
MKDIQYMNYTSANCSGPAIKLGAGIQVEEAYEAAHQRAALVVGGDCATVGVVGGYLQGGGHSALSSLYGLSADHTLEWKVVDGTGQLHTATPERNADLFWALSGGGGGTYGIASSVTMKLHPDVPLTGVALSFELDLQRPQAFHNAVRKYHDLVPRVTARQGMGIAAITNSSFLLTPLTLTRLSRNEALVLIEPLLRELNDQDVRYQLNLTAAPNWLEYWRRLIKPNPTQLVENGQYGGWMVPRTVLDTNADALQAAVQDVTGAGCTFVGLALDVSLPAGSGVRNSVLLAWRDAALNVILSIPWPQRADLHHMKEQADAMTQRCVPALARLAPQAGAYMNEADPNQPDWKKAFYGVNYDRLLEIKKKYDPNNIFYAQTAVGSDYWKVDSDGRPCQPQVSRTHDSQ